MKAIQSTQPMKVMIYNTQAEDDQVEQIVTALIEWNAHTNYFKKYIENGKEKVLAPFNLGFLSISAYHEHPLWWMSEKLKECVLYVSGHKAGGNYGKEVKIPSHVCKAVRESPRFLETLQSLSEKERWTMYVPGGIT